MPAPRDSDLQVSEEARADAELAQLVGLRTVRSWTPEEEAAEIARKSAWPFEINRA